MKRESNNGKDEKQGKGMNEAERRFYKRYQAKDGALAFIDSIPGRIVDISEGGMSINYMVFEKEITSSLMLDIFFNDDKFFLQNIPARVVSEKVKEPLTPFSSVVIRRYSIRFGDLSEDQREKLNYFIHHNTEIEA